VTVAQKATIDWLGIEKGTGNVILTVVDDLDWSDETGHLLALQEKLNTYLAFIESGEIFERLTEDVGRTVPRSAPIMVSILAKYVLSDRAKAFVEHARARFHEAGFELRFKLIVAQNAAS
jgi:hypothetical protein